MNTHPEEPVPAEMPKGLERVYAALEAPLDPAPDALLGRILSSRAAGVRAVLPIGRRRASLFRRRLVRGAIAAGLGLVALASWSRWLRPSSDGPDSTSVAALGFPMGDEFGFATPAAAQGGPSPKFAPMIFDPGRLHAVRLRYVRRMFRNGKASGTDTVVRALQHSAGQDESWVLTTERSVTDDQKHPVTAHMVDTVRLERATLRSLSEVYAVRITDGGSANYRWTIGDSTATLHAEHRYVRFRPVPGGKERVGIVTRITDTLLTLPRSRYSRAVTNVEAVIKLMAAPIGPGWKGSLLLTMPGADVAALPMDFELVGQQWINSPTGKIDCWKLRGGTTAQVTYLVRKSDGVLISQRIEQKVKDERMLMEMVLIEER